MTQAESQKKASKKMGGSGILLGLVGLAVLAAVSMKKDNIDRGGHKPGDKDENGLPIVPKLIPDSEMTLEITSDMILAPKKWATDGLRAALTAKGDTPAVVANKLVYVGVLADQIFLNPPGIKADQDSIAEWLDANGFVYGHELLQDRRTGKVLGTWTVKFDANLPAGVRSYMFWLIARQDNEMINDLLKTPDYQKWPKFRDSVIYLRDHGLDKPGTDTEKEKKTPENGVNLDRPETWVLPDTDGPDTVETPKGTLFVPKGGKIRNGEPAYVVQDGDYSGKIIAEKWGKTEPGWDSAIASVNPSETFGGSSNTVFVGDALHMPYGFLDPTDFPAPHKGGGTGNGKGKDGKPIPAKPSTSPGAGNVWVYDIDSDAWVAQPASQVQSAMPSTSPGVGKYWAFDWSSGEWVAMPVQVPAPDGDDGETPYQPV